VAPETVQTSGTETHCNVWRESWEEMFPSEEYYQIKHLKLFPKGLIHAENVGGEIEKVSNQRVWIGCFPLRASS
jgi:hypothetical protein